MTFFVMPFLKKIISQYALRVFFLGGMVVLFSTCKKDLPPIRIGMALWPGYEFMYLADKKGFFKEEGVNIRLYDFVSLSDSRRSFERGQIDIVAGTISELLIIHETSRRFPQAFFVVDFSNGADVIIGRKPIQNVTDLRGKRVGVEPMSMDILTIDLALKKNKMKLSDVNLVPIAQNGMTACFQKNDVDALCTYPPTSVKIMNLGTANCLFNSSEIPGYIIDLLIADKPFIDKRTEDLAKIIRCIDRAIRYWKDKPEEALALMAEHEQISVKDLQDAYAGIEVETLADQKQYFQANGQLFKASETASGILNETGVLHQNLNAATIINPGPVTVAMPNRTP